MQKVVLILIVFFLGGSQLISQSIFIKRSDVDSARFNFVTASYPFTIDVYISDLAKTNGVAFELDYSLAKYIKFSQWRIGDYSTPQVVAFEDTMGTGKLVVAVSSGENVQSDSNLTPKVISLEFVTLQNAPNNLVNVFNFVKPVATVIDSNGRSSVFLNADTSYLNIHGYVSVWPGDTDNNGLVDHLDFAPITQYIGFGSLTKNMKSFKRKSGSAIWGPHRVLTWDSAAVTYADTDGNGDVTISDMLIVTYNLNKDTNTYKAKKNSDEIQSKLPAAIYYDLSNVKRIPINLNQNINLYAITGIIDISNFRDKVIGIEPGNIFTSHPFNYSIKQNGQLSFALGSYTRELSLNNGIIGNIVVADDFVANIRDYFIDLKGIDKLGNIVELQSINSVNDLAPEEVDFNSDKINFNSPFNNVYVYDVIGNCIYTFKNQQNINTSNWSYGLYFLQIQSNNSYKTIKYMKID